MSNLQDIAEEVFSEVKSSTKKHGEQYHVPLGGGTYRDARAADRARRTTDLHAEEGTVTWQDILREEYLEAFAEVDPALVRKEMVQVAAVAFKIIDSIDVTAELANSSPIEVI